MYIKDKDLLKQIIISKGKGKLTRKAEGMLFTLATNVTFKMSYYDHNTKHDCMMQGVYRLLLGWKHFDTKKYDCALPYFTEVFKRGIAEGYNMLKNIKSGECVRTINIQSEKIKFLY